MYDSIRNCDRPVSEACEMLLVGSNRPISVQEAHSNFPAQNSGLYVMQLRENQR